MNGYDLSRQWFDFAFENPEKVSSKHCALYMWIIEKNNRLGWVEKFGLPMDEAGAAIGIKKIQTVREALIDLSEWGFVRFVVKSKNQYQSNVISIINCHVQSGDSLSKTICLTENRLSTGQALVEQSVEHGVSTVPINKPINNKTIKHINIDFDIFWNAYDKKVDRTKAEKKWVSLTDTQRELAIADIPKYLASLRDRQFQKNPLTYLNGECWQDERDSAKVFPIGIQHQVNKNSYV